ncbi:MAG: hypothetical protein IH984_12185 [Planctomycetes bacterium]|nr:hypothetical protein [Planctomycetota bacterium]
MQGCPDAAYPQVTAPRVIESYDELGELLDDPGLAISTRGPGVGDRGGSAADSDSDSTRPGGDAEPGPVQPPTGVPPTVAGGAGGVQPGGRGEPDTTTFAGGDIGTGGVKQPVSSDDVSSGGRPSIDEAGITPTDAIPGEGVEQPAGGAVDQGSVPGALDDGTGGVGLSNLSDKDLAEAQRLKEELKTLLGETRGRTPTLGFDPEEAAKIFSVGVRLGHLYVKSGMKKFAEFAKALVRDIGEKIRPFLKSIYLGVRNFPGTDTKGMTPYAERSLTSNSSRKH